MLECCAMKLISKHEYIDQSNFTEHSLDDSCLLWLGCYTLTSKFFGGPSSGKKDSVNHHN
jgi:hypothetical protein